MDYYQHFYQNTVASLLSESLISRESKILVVCGGTLDRQVFLDLGFTNVVISNVDTRTQPAQFAPFEWSFQDAEGLSFEDDSFDYCVVHSGLHHCQSPHKGLLEMYRVARLGVLVFEPLDNFTTRVGVRLGLGQEYEIAAVAGNEYRFGGVRNTPIPNYVYRFTEREIVKTLKTYAPVGENRYRFFYALRVPWLHYRMSKNKIKLLTVGFAYPFLKLLTTIFPRESNNFGFFVQKPRLPDQIHPWLRTDNGEIVINREWVEKDYPQSAEVVGG